jgi:hypothetical protein
MRKSIVIIVLFLLISPTILYAQSAKDAMKSLMKVEAIAKDNPSGRDFINAYADAKAEVNLYLDGLEAKKNRKLATTIEKTSDAYKWAATFWNLKFNKAPYVHEYDDFMKNFYKIYPSSHEILKGTIALDSAITWCYSEASNNLTEARKILSK